MNVGSVMTRNPEGVRSQETVKKAAELMRNIDVGVVPVFEEGDKAVGMLTDRDITVRAVAEGKDPESTRVSEIMTRGAVTCREETEAPEACKIMESQQIRRLLVTDDQGAVVGVVSMGDLALSLGKEMAGEAIREVSKPAQPER